MGNKRLSLRISGRVQGIGYRWFVRETAQELGATGWVRNEPDGTVSAEAQAPSESMDLLLSRLKNGNSAARVAAISAHELPEINPDEGFEIKI